MSTGGSSGAATGGAGGALTGGGGGGGGGGGMRPDPGPFVPPKCADESMARPPNAPVLEAGVWKNISPEGVPFRAENGSFTQGMTMDPCNPGTLYVCIVGFADDVRSSNGLYRTVDGGSSWRRIGPFGTPIRVRVDPRDPKHLYVADGVTGDTFGFWVSKDGGETWAIPESFRELAGKGGLIFDTYHVEPDPADFNHVLVTFHNPWADSKYNGNSGFIESFDGGDSWTVHPPVNNSWAGGYNIFFLYDPVKKIGDANTWLFGTQGDGYYRTADAGATWKKVTEVNMDHGGGSIYYAPDGTLYASGAPNVLRSKDNGETWTELTPTQFTAFLTINGDGQSIFAQPHFGGQVKTAKLGADTTWTTLTEDPPEFLDSGSFEMVMDRKNGVLYNAATGAGIWALQLPR
jgi:hypothetical protein